MTEPSQPAPAAPSELATLHPAYFALVMATGIVSLGWWLLGWPTGARVLFGLNLFLYAALWGAFAARALRHRSLFLADLKHHGRAVGFFTLAAATCVVGSQWVVIGGAPEVASGFWAAGIALYVVLVYSIFTALTVKAEKPPLSEGLNGGWLVSVVGAQAISVLGAQLSASSSDPEPMLFFSVVMWLGGGMLYLWIISLIFYRYTFFTLAPSDLAPPYWINMGAAAISTLAGATLVTAGARSPLLGSLLPFLRGFTLMWWATATWWVPMLLLLGIWRHLLRRLPLRYDPLYWGAVFPLGMYTVATFRLANALELPFLDGIPRVGIWVASAAWGLTFAGLIGHLVRARVASRGRHG